ncbi:MAG: DNRLRE domain-containing protein [Akkermansiaceae bacterium]|nr:DNRLRE domain-containing protein [Akkermansiaceae bacterium]MDG2322325.1 DNRLRE domain-containing protein [Akkermansiaceae bacterium]
MSLKKRTATALPFAALALAAGSASAATVSFQEGVSPTAGLAHDAVFIRSGTNADINQNTSDQIIIGTTAGGGSAAIRGLLEFDISAIPATNVIDLASLVLTTHSAGINNVGVAAAITSFDVYSYGFNFDETTATWNDPAVGDSSDGGTVGTFLTSASIDVESAAGVTIAFGSSSAFTTAVGDALAGDGQLRLIIRNNDESTVGTHNFARFAAEDFATTGSRPELVIEHSMIPEPSSLALLGLGGLALLRRRRK